jgi:hypothetical protein
LFRNNDSTSNPADGPDRGDLLLGLVFCGDPCGEERLRGARGVDVAEEVDALAKWGGIDEAISPGAMGIAIPVWLILVLWIKMGEGR